MEQSGHEGMNNTGKLGIEWSASEGNEREGKGRHDLGILRTPSVEQMCAPSSTHYHRHRQHHFIAFKQFYIVSPIVGEVM